jgi:hypothetical protein
MNTKEAVKTKEIKIEVIFSSKNPSMQEVLPIGYKTTIEVYTTPEDVLIPVKKLVDKDKNGNYRIHIYHEVFIPKGNYCGYRFKGANGHYYDDSFIYRTVGPKPMSEMFKKLN